MNFYKFSIVSEGYGPIFGIVTAENQDEAKEKVTALCGRLNITIIEITINPITRVPEKIRDLADYFSEPRISMSLGEDTIRFGY